MTIRLASIWSGALVLALVACDDLRMPPPPGAPEKTAAPAHPAATMTPHRARPAPTSGKVTPESEARAVGVIRSSLRRLVAAEETFFAENGVYTDDLERIGFVLPPDIQLRFLWMSRDGWAVSGTHPAFAGRDCVIYVGRKRGAPTTLKNVRRGGEGVPVCDATRAAPTPAAPTASSPTPAPAAQAATVPDTGSALDAVDPFVQMKVDLRNLDRSQSTYFAQQGIYARRTNTFALQYLWHRGVTITVLSADAESWSARATHRLRPGKSCVIWYGPVSILPATTAEKRVPDRAVVPACDD